MKQRGGEHIERKNTKIKVNRPSLCENMKLKPRNTKYSSPKTSHHQTDALVNATVDISLIPDDG